MILILHGFVLYALQNLGATPFKSDAIHMEDLFTQLFQLFIGLSAVYQAIKW